MQLFLLSELYFDLSLKNASWIMQTFVFTSKTSAIWIGFKSVLYSIMIKVTSDETSYNDQHSTLILQIDGKQ